MPWQETDAMDQRIQLVVRALEDGVNRSELCREFGVSRKTAYKWLKRYEEVGTLQGLSEKSRRPRGCPHQTSPEIEERVVALRGVDGWGGDKVSRLLKREGIHLPAGTVDRVLRRRGLTKSKSNGPVASLRFERAKPNELWQMDFKGPIQKEGVWSSTPLSLLDDHSRFLVGLHPVQELTEAVALPALVSSFEEFGLPEAMLMDHGVPWWSTTNGHGLTKFSVHLIEQGIQLIYGRIRHPQTQGKVERFHGTLKASFRHHGIPSTLSEFQSALATFRTVYNEIRPHEALGLEVPASRYQKSPRSYQTKPRDWEYPEGSEVRRLNSQGMLSLGGSRIFVCEALAGRLVRCQRFANKMLVTYHQTEIRELDLTNGRTVALARPSRKT